MSWDISKLPERQAGLPSGTLRYRDVGSGDPLVFIHGVMVNGNLWQPVVSALGQEFRCLVPDLPLGSHETPFPPQADLSPIALCDLLRSFLDHLEIERAILVGNDTGGALCQLAVSRFPERIKGLVLTPSDAYEVFPPKEFGYLSAVASVPGLLALVSRAVQFRPINRSRLGYGLLTKAGFSDEFAQSFVRPGLRSDVRRDLRKVIRGISNQYTLDASLDFGSYPDPVLIVWPKDNPVFSAALAERLANDFPASRLVYVNDSYTYLPYDQPESLADNIRSFVRDNFGSG